MKSIILILISLLFSFNSHHTSTRQLNVVELTEDVSVLRKALEKNHPGLYWYTSKDQFNRTWDSVNTHIDKPMSDIQFLGLVLPIIAKVKCAHTLFYPSEEILTSGARFPFDLKFIDGHGYILTDSLNQYKIPGGSELLTVNGKSLKEIVDLLLPGLMAQGGNLGWKYAILENDFQNYYYYRIDQSESFTIEYIDFVTRQKVVRRITGSAEDVRRRHWKNWYPKKDGAPLSIQFPLGHDAAIITIKSFSRGRHKAYQQDFDELIDQYFGEVKKKGIKNLIIDLRGNEGGNNPEKLYSYIANENDKNVDGSKKPISPAKNVFRGKVIVLMNERSISAQESFVAIFKNNNRGLTIGRSTPGSYDGLCGGNKKKIILPNSHFEIQIPLHTSNWTYSHPTSYHIGEGFPPDFKVERSIEDILSGKDSAMELALDKLVSR